MVLQFRCDRQNLISDLRKWTENIRLGTTYVAIVRAGIPQAETREFHCPCTISNKIQMALQRFVKLTNILPRFDSHHLHIPNT